jgi:hypothetical protein
MPKEPAFEKFFDVTRKFQVERVNPHVDLTLSKFHTRDTKIRKKYESLGGEATLGATIEQQVGTLWRFKSAAIVYDEHSDAAYEIHGAIYQKWFEAGGLKFGVPCTDETPTPDREGRFNHFNKNTASIYWTPRTGAHTIYGAIRQRWSELGGEKSYLGYPTSDEVAFADGGRANEFEHGGIYWWPDTGPIDLRDVVVHYTGLHCFGETSWDQGSDSDEPYVIFALTTPQNAWAVNTRTYEDVDAKEQRPDLLELYRGRPYGINIGIIVMERDFGDPNKYRQQVLDVVMGVHSAGTIALGLIPIVGPAIAAVAGPALGSLMPSLGGAINDAFDWGDDRIGAATITLGGRDLVLLAAQTANSTFGSIGFKVESPLISGLGASYKVYLGVVPA